MRKPRIYCPLDVPEVGGEVELDLESSHYLLNVLRCKINDALNIFNGNNFSYMAIIEAITKKIVTIKITEAEFKNIESPLKIHLIQSMSKGDKMDYIIQKSTELGVTSITPIFTERCEVVLSNDRIEKKLQTWRKIAIQACMQSGRNTLPIIHTPLTFNECVKQSFEGNRIILSPESSHKIKDLNLNHTIQLIIGPEGGLSEDEINYATNYSFIDITLGQRILRTETAGLAVISCLQVLKGDF